VDRTHEHLSEGDEGLVLLRGKLFSQIALIADGGEPKGVLRNPLENQALRLPFTKPIASLPNSADAAAEPSFPYLAGQPEDAAEAYRKVLESWQRQDKAEGP
jgi:5,5'-dehydrodivanillate O-demethylase